MRIALPFYLGLTLLLAATAGRSDVPDTAVWIDVRSGLEYAMGHLPQATRIHYEEIEEGVAELNLDKDAHIYLYCAVGGRADIAKERLEAIGYTNVTNAGSLESARAMAQPSGQ
jgi:phage shock protein E